MWPSTIWTLLSFTTTVICAQIPAQTFFPASIPLAVRSPYMSIWHPSTNTSDALSNSWPELWRQQGDTSSVGWAGKIRIDNMTYAWMGHDLIENAPANVTNVQVTPTRAIFAMQAGPMNFTVTFLSPIEPSDWVKQSLPFYYVYLEISSLDRASHNVQVIWDGTGEILSGNKSSGIQWSIQNTGSNFYHEIQLQEPQPYVEIADQAQDGKAYYVTSVQSGLTWQEDMWNPLDSQFRNEGTLTKAMGTDYGPISPAFNAFGLAIDLGDITATSSPIVWAQGYVRDPAVNYTTPSGETEQRSPFFLTQYSRIGDAIDALMADFPAARDRAVALDNKIMQDAAKVSPQYVDLVSLAARQTFGCLDITVGSDSQGNLNASNVMVFMKDIGTSARTNPVERIFAAFPAFIYFNASIGGGLLRPLLESQDGLTAEPYAMQDMGIQYPSAQVIPGAHTSGIEQTGNMLIMMYAYARVSGDGSLLAQHYNLTKQWADYLVNNALTPMNQKSADSEIVANMTNLALKGIIGVKAMAGISRAVGEDFDSAHYDSTASALIGTWESLAMSSDNTHLLGVYNDQQSWSLLYNLYADQLLGTNLVPKSVLDGHTQFLSILLSTTHPFGLPIDSTIGLTSSAAWTLFTAASVTDTGVRDQLVQGVWARTAINTTQGAFPDLYNNVTGETISGTAGPALGAMFSILALTVPNTTITVLGSNTGGAGNNNGNNTVSKSKSKIAPIVGGVVGGLALIGIAAGMGIYFLRRRRSNKLYTTEKINLFADHLLPDPFPSPNLATEYGVSSDYVAVPGIANPAAAPAAWAAGPSFATMQAAPPATGYPSKAREAGLNTHQNSSPDSSSALLDERFFSSPPGSSRDLFSQGDTGSFTTTDVVGLRHEVENLRRVVQEIHEERLAPPPGYSG